MRFLAVFFFLSLVVLTKADSDTDLVSYYLSSNELLGSCESTDLVYQQGCVGYIRGVFDTHSLLTWRNHSQPYFCTPPNVQTGQLQKIVIKHLKANPELLHFTASVHVVEALKKAFPCK